MITFQWNENFMEFLHEDLPGSEAMTPVFSIHNGESQWKEMFALFSAEENKFYWITSAGCECCDTLFAHVGSVNDLTTGSAKDVKKAVRTLLKDSPGILTEDEKVKVFSKVGKFA